MSSPYCYEYPRPAVTVDLVAFAWVDDDLRVALIRRGKDPFAGRWAIPGGFLDMDEPADVGAKRELREETGLEIVGPVSPIGFFAAPERDPRGRTISLAHAAILPPGPHPILGSDDASEAAWKTLGEAVELAFDHQVVLAVALDWLRRQVAEEHGAVAILPSPDLAPRLRLTLGLPSA